MVTKAKRAAANTANMDTTDEEAALMQLEEAHCPLAAARMVIPFPKALVIV